jgi:hypothetical protein
MQTGVIARHSGNVGRRLASETPWREVLAAFLDGRDSAVTRRA